MNTRLWVRIGLLAFVLAAATLLLAWQARGAGAVDPTPVAVTLKEFTLTPVPANAPVGDVQFNATNQGALPHEMVLLKTDLAPNALPKRTNGQDKVDEEGAGVQFIGEIEVTELGAGHSASATMSLTAGKYVLICNVEGHYTANMYSAFTVGAVATASPTPAPTASPTPAPTAAPTASPAPTAAPTASPAPTAAALPKTGGAPGADTGLIWVWLIVGLALIGAASLAWRWPVR